MVQFLGGRAVKRALTPRIKLGKPFFVIELNLKRKDGGADSNLRNATCEDAK
jgi:hypothetical protein